MCPVRFSSFGHLLFPPPWMYRSRNPPGGIHALMKPGGQDTLSVPSWLAYQCIPLYWLSLFAMLSICSYRFHITYILPCTAIFNNWHRANPGQAPPLYSVPLEMSFHLEGFSEHWAFLLLLKKPRLKLGFETDKRPAIISWPAHTQLDQHNFGGYRLDHNSSYFLFLEHFFVSVSLRSTNKM